MIEGGGLNRSFYNTVTPQYNVPRYKANRL